MNRSARQYLRHRRAGQSGFTLIELLVVIAILAILAAVVLFNILGVSKSAQTNSCRTDEKTVTSAAASYYSDNSNTWPAIAGLTGDGTSTDSFGGLVTTYLQQAPPASDGSWSLDTTTGAASASACP